jgi:hypothetical protein
VTIDSIQKWRQWPTDQIGQRQANKKVGRWRRWALGLKVVQVRASFVIQRIEAILFDGSEPISRMRSAGSLRAVPFSLKFAELCHEFEAAHILRDEESSG